MFGCRRAIKYINQTDLLHFDNLTACRAAPFHIRCLGAAVGPRMPRIAKAESSQHNCAKCQAPPDEERSL